MSQNPILVTFSPISGLFWGLQCFLSCRGSHCSQPLDLQRKSFPADWARPSHHRYCCQQAAAEAALLEELGARVASQLLLLLWAACRRLERCWKQAAVAGFCRPCHHLLPPRVAPRAIRIVMSESVKCRFSKCRFSVLNLKFDFISDGGCTREKQIQKALGSLPPCGNRCRFSESAICSSWVRPPSEIKSNFKFKTLRWRPLRWRLTLSE